MIFQTPTPDIEKSKSFYERLGFEVRQTDKRSLQVSSSDLKIFVNQNRFARAGIRLYDISETQLDTIKSATRLQIIDDYYVFTDAGIFFYLFEKSEKNQDFKYSEAIPILGNFAGLSIETANTKRTFNIWRTLGFDVKSGGSF